MPFLGVRQTYLDSRHLRVPSKGFSRQIFRFQSA
jgi:hypothetical protein